MDAELIGFGVPLDDEDTKPGTLFLARHKGAVALCFAVKIGQDDLVLILRSEGSEGFEAPMLVEMHDIGGPCEGFSEPLAFVETSGELSGGTTNLCAPALGCVVI